MNSILLDVFKHEMTWHFVDWNKDRTGKLIENGDRIDLEVCARGKSDNLPLKDSEVFAISKPGSRVSIIQPYSFGHTLIGGKTFSKYMSHILVLQLFETRKTKHKVNNIRCDFPQLNIWLGVDKTSFDYQTKQFKDSTDTTVHVPLNKMRLTLNVALTTSSNDDELVSKNDNSVEMSFDTDREYWYAIYEMRVFEALINFTFTSPHYASEFTTIAPSRNTLGIAKYIYAHSFDGSNERKYRFNFNYSLLFRYDKLSNGPAIITKWYEVYQELAPVIENITMFKTVETTSNTMFLTYINSIELFHTQFFDHPKIDDAEYKELKSRVKTALSDVDYSSISGLLGMAKTLSIKQRMIEIRAIAHKHGCQFITDEEIDKAMNTRRKYVHNAKVSQNKMFMTYEVSRINRILGQYLKASILHMLGVTESDLREIVATSHQFRDYYRDQL